MANNHTNLLAIAANEEDMCKVLIRMAMNLAANKEYTRFDITKIEGLSTAQDLYRQVGPKVDASYIYAFAGAPLPEDVSEAHTPGWTSSTSSEGGFMLQMAALMSATQKINENAPEGTSVSFSMTAPTGRAMSDSAIVEFMKYDENWVLTIEYDTAWTPNSDDLDVFFMGLPEGDYGVAFFDADEYDDYDSVNYFSGLHHGHDVMQSFDDDGGEFELYESSDIKAKKKEYANVPKSSISSITQLAKMAAFGAWSQLGWDGDEEGYGYSSYGDGGESVNTWTRLSVNWYDPTPEDKQLVVSAVVDVLAALPFTVSLHYGWTKEGNEAVESLLPGDEVVVLGEWAGSDFSMLQVEMVDGKRIGAIAGWYHLVQDYGINSIAHAVLALILPHIRATVYELTPVSFRKKGVEGPAMSIRLDALPLEFADVMSEVEQMLDKDCSERSLSTNVKGAM